MIEDRNNVNWRRTVLLLAWFPLLQMHFVQASENKFRSENIRQEFEAACPRPHWWDRVSIDGVNIRTYDELLEYWQNKERSKNQFFKAAYQAVLDYPLDTDIVVNAIKLMPYGDSSYSHTAAMLEFAVNKYFFYSRPVHNYGGKAGDAVAGIVEKLAAIYNRQNQYYKSIYQIERLLLEREHEINDHLLELVTLVYAEALYRENRKSDAKVVLKKAIEKYNGSWKNRLRDRLDQYDR